MRDGVLVHAHARERIVYVGHRDHLRGNGDVVALEAVGIALAVPTLVVPARDLVCVLQQGIAGMLTAQLKQHICAEGGVGLHDLELLGRQASGLVENSIVDRHLADIVQR